MNFLLCNRCKKRSDDNIFNLNNINNNNYNELSKKRKNNLSNATNIDNNIINQADTSEKFQPMDYLKNSDEINMNIKDLEEDSDDGLKIIEYPYKQTNVKNEINEDKIKPKEFINNESKFNENFFDEKNIIKNITNIKYQIKTNNNKNNIEKKDTIFDPSNLALSNLIFDINKKSFDRNGSGCQKNNKKFLKEKQEINSIQNIKYFITNKNDNCKNKNKINIKKKENIIRKNNKNLYINHIKSENNFGRVKENEYSNNIKKKKNILKNKIISNKNLYINNLSISNLIINSKKNNFTKSYSFNYFENGNNNNMNKYRNETTNNNLRYKLILNNNKKGNTVLLSPHIYKNTNKITNNS